MIDTMKNELGSNPQFPPRAIEALDTLLSTYSPKECTDMMLRSMAYIVEASEDEKEPLHFLHNLTLVFRELEYPDGDPDTTE